MYLKLILTAVRQFWGTYLLVSLGFTVLYYVGLLLLTVIRFGEIPNYYVFHDVFATYGLIFSGTPSLTDALIILMDEPWFETGYKNPDYYGVATWSYMLIPPKMMLVLLMGLLLGLFAVLMRYSNKMVCNVKMDKQLYVAAGMGSALIAMTSATLTWVVCCATPSWVVALAMLGMSASLALWLEPLGKIMTIAGLLVMLWIIFVKAKSITLKTCAAGAQ